MNGAEIQDALDRILASDAFGRSDQLRRLLQYIVEKEQAGKASELKGYSIAIDVLGRPTDFDAGSDPIVRVQAGKLRRMLELYYATTGASDPVRITIPVGSYVPVYETASSKSELDAPARPSRWPRGGTALSVAVITLGALLAAYLGYLLVEKNTPLTVADTTRNASTALPRQILHSDSDLVALPEISIIDAGNGETGTKEVIAGLKRALPLFPTVTTVDDGTVPNGTSQSTSETSARRFHYEVSAASDESNILIELLHPASGRVLATNSISPETLKSKVETRRFLSRFLSQELSLSGEIYAFMKLNGLGSELVQCLLNTEAYFNQQNAKNHEIASQCVESLIEKDAASPLLYADMATLTLEAITDVFPMQTSPTIEQAIAYAKRAVELGPTNPYAFRAYGAVLGIAAGREESLAQMRKAAELNPYDLNISASYGYSLVFAGEYDEGSEVLREAIMAAASHPDWWDYSLSLAALMRGDMAEARRAQAGFIASERTPHLALRLILEDLAGREAEAEKLKDMLAQRDTLMANDPAAYFERANYPPDMTAKLVELLAQAGYPNK